MSRLVSRLRRRPAGPARGLPVLGLIAALTAVGLACGAGLPARAAPAAAARPAVAAAARPAVAAPPGAVRSSSLASPVRRLLLINGDGLAVTTAGGRQTVAVRSAAARDAVTSLRFGGQVLEIPTIAMPYLGHGLSPSLFELSALEKAESGGRLPVQVAFTGRRPVIPGLTVTRSSAGRASGYLTAASARTFGAALWRQYRADHARGSYGSDGLFGRGISISVAGAPAPASPARPDFPMRTLTVHATGPGGRPDTGDQIFIASADNVARFDGLMETSNFFWHGSAKFSLPVGHYWAIATFASFSGNSAALRMVVLPQFTVAGRHATLHIAARSASSKFTMPTPRRSVVQQQSFLIVRGARTGGPFSYGQGWSGFTGWVNPTTRKPTVGTLRTYTSGTNTSPRKVSPGYAYNLDFPGPAGIIPPQHFTVTPASLGAVTERFYQDVPTNLAGWVAFGGTPAQLQGEFQLVLQFHLPQVQTQYFSAGRNLLWSLQTIANLNQFSGFNTDLYRTYAGGQRETQTWNEFPLHPAPDTTLGGLSAVFPTLASASRAGDTLNLSFTPFSDNQFGHLGPGFFGNGSALVTGTYAVAQNGKTIAHGKALNGIPGIRLSSKPSTLRFTLTANRYSSFFPLSSGSRTVWTWPSARDTAARVPAAWYCSLTFTRRGLSFHRQCAVQHLMTLSYQVQGMSLTGLTKPGPQVVNVTAGHIQLGGSAAVTGAQAQVSFNDGDTWFPATVTAHGGGRFRVSYSAPAGVDVTLRVSATDAAGGAISETIVRGYGVSR